MVEHVVINERKKWKIIEKELSEKIYPAKLIYVMLLNLIAIKTYLLFETLAYYSDNYNNLFLSSVNILIFTILYLITCYRVIVQTRKDYVEFSTTDIIFTSILVILLAYSYVTFNSIEMIKP